MNKLFTKIAALVLGMTMAVGVGVAVGAKQNDAIQANADSSSSVTFSDLSLGNGHVMTSSDVSLENGLITFAWDKGSGSNAPTYYTSGTSVRLYCPKSTSGSGLGGKVTISLTDSDHYITSITYSFGTTVTSKGVVTAGSLASVEHSISSGGTVTTATYTSANNIQSVVFQAKNTSSSTKQCYLSGVSVSYAGGTTTTEATGMTITPTTSTTIYAGESVSFTTTLTGGSGGYEKTIGWTSNNSSVIPAPSNSEEGDTVTVTATNSVATQTIVRLTGTVVSPGSATNYIDITVKPARTMQSISLHGTIEKDEYYVGDSWDLTGLDIQVNWSEGDPTYVKFDDEEVDYECKPATADVTTRISFDIDVAYGDFFETFTVEGITISEAPLEYYIEFGTIKNSNPSEITTDAAFKTAYPFKGSSDVTVGPFEKIYGTDSTNMLKLGSGKATASLTFTIPSDAYITSLVIVVNTAGGTSLNVTSGASSASTENQPISVGTLTFDDYLSSEKSNSVTMESTANGAFYLTSITIKYASAGPVTTYTVTYDANGGTGTLTDPDSPYNSGATVTTLDNTFTRDGYNFSSWNTDSEGNGTSYNEGDTFTITANTTLYAIWTSGPAPVDIAARCYTLVNDADDLNIGDKIIITSIASEDSAKALSTTQNTNNRSATDPISIENGVAVVDSNDVQVITLSQSNSHWEFNVGNGYLYAASSSKNYLKTQSTNDANGEWVISISNGSATITAQGTNTHNILRYNSKDTLFSCYASGQSAVQIYKLSFEETLLHNVTCDGDGSHSMPSGYTWNNNLKGVFDDLPETERIDLKTASNKGLARYDYIVGKYNPTLSSDSDYKDFIDRKPSPISGLRFMPIFGTTENTNAIAIVVIVSVVSLTAIGGYFFLRKKREQN